MLEPNFGDLQEYLEHAVQGAAQLAGQFLPLVPKDLGVMMFQLVLNH
jgi:hypothetical protein